MSLRSMLVLSCAAVTVSAVPAVARTVNFDNSAGIEVLGVSPFLINYADLGGMEVSWSFANGGSGSGVWSDLGGGVWGVDDDDFSLTAYGNVQTYFGLWSLSGVGLSGFSIN